MSFIVAIDGPAGTGKGTITKLIAEELGLINIDTGAMYRCVALEALRKNIDDTEIEKVEEILKNIEIKFKRENGKNAGNIYKRNKKLLTSISCFFIM